MSVSIELPEQFRFTTEVQVYINDLAGGLHVGNHVLISYLNEAQMRLITALGFPALLVNNCITYNVDLTIQYRAEARYPDKLLIEGEIINVREKSYDIVFRMTNLASGKEVVRAMVGMVFVDQGSGRITSIPTAFLEALAQFQP